MAEEQFSRNASNGNDNTQNACHFYSADVNKGRTVSAQATLDGGEALGRSIFSAFQ